MMIYAYAFIILLNRNCSRKVFANAVRNSSQGLDVSNRVTEPVDAYERYGHMKRKIVILLSVFLLMACNLPALVPTATITPRPTIPPNTPGLIVHGYVTLNGVGLADVPVYKRFAAYPWEQIATTDENGYYESEFIYIPGDEMVSIQVELEGYNFEPPYYFWRHYYGLEDTTRDFVASPIP
jgi:hypothetical protein